MKKSFTLPDVFKYLHQNQALLLANQQGIAEILSVLKKTDLKDEVANLKQRTSDLIKEIGNS